MPAAASLSRGMICEAGEHDDVFTKRLERLENARERKLFAGRSRLPVIHDDAVRNIDHGHTKSLFPDLRWSGQSRAHRVERR
jgi:hypothetical protein